MRLQDRREVRARRQHGRWRLAATGGVLALMVGAACWARWRPLAPSASGARTASAAAAPTPAGAGSRSPAPSCRRSPPGPASLPTPTAAPTVVPTPVVVPTLTTGGLSRAGQHQVRSHARSGSGTTPRRHCARAPPTTPRSSPAAAVEPAEADRDSARLAAGPVRRRRRHARRPARAGSRPATSAEWIRQRSG